MQDIEDPELEKDSSSDSDSSSGSEDIVCKLSNENKTLKEAISSLKESVANTKRDLTLTNNLRLAQRNELKALKRKLEEKTEECEILSRRNVALQDSLCQKYSGIYYFLVVN